MSTRCQIGYYRDFEDEVPEVLLYKHSDGYPEDTLVAIADFLKEFVPARGVEVPEYLMAQLLVSLVNRSNRERDAFEAKFYADRPAAREPNFLGFGICGDKQLHYDIEYLYKITPAGVQVYRVASVDVTGKGLLTARQAKAVLRGVVPKSIKR
jgi:hypothetical protein